jgi:ubiquinone/menaquinone biosynthesis C-methylase UbiE
MVLSYSQLRNFYDHFGKKQDSQAFYEDAALDELVAHAEFERASSVFEFGCGTGRFAHRLLGELLPSEARYVGVDISSTMINLSRERLSVFPGRVELIESLGPIHFPLDDNSVDRVISTYVLDLLSTWDILRFLDEARRVLVPGGKLAIMSITPGTNLPTKLVMAIWRGLFWLRPSLVGGCRPIHLRSRLEDSDWTVEHHQVVPRYCVASEVLVATPKKS